MNLIKRTIGQLLLIGAVFFINHTAYSQEPAGDSATLKKAKTLDDVVELLKKMKENMTPEQKKANEERRRLAEGAKPSVITVDVPGKAVAFIPMIHVSTAGFYNKVKDTVEKYKANGYRVYYEQVKSKPKNAADTITKDTLALKFRKMLGVEPNRETYSLLSKISSSIIVQPSYKELGVTATDINADVSIEEMVKKYEQLYGTVVLSPCDFETRPGTFPYPCEKLNNEMDPITIDFRNEYVVNLIKQSGDDKILVIYGAAHIDGMKELLQK